MRYNILLGLGFGSHRHGSMIRNVSYTSVIPVPDGTETHVVPRCHAPVLSKPKPRLRSLFLRRSNQYFIFLATLSRSSDFECRAGSLLAVLGVSQGGYPLHVFNNNTSVVPVPDGTES